MTPAEYDFRKPPPGDIERNVTAWLTLACRRTNEAAVQALRYPATLQIAKVETPSAAYCLAFFPEGAISVPLAPPDAPGGGALLVFPNPVLIALLSGLIGEAPEALPADREPTPMESALIPHLVREFFVTPFLKSWPGVEPLVVDIGAPAAPAAVWTGGNEHNIFVTFTLSAPYGEHPIYLLLTRSGRWEQLAAIGLSPPVTPAPKSEIESVVRAMSVEMSVILGRADLTMRDVSDLTTGDVIVFDQKVTEPLDGLVSGARKFRVWPGVVGDRAAVVVDTITGD
ncbi:flagellar motor switch protein FliM [Gemmata obscuriglobus]|uniref:Flagellar motor switch protein FliM n=1 Tax=Gemmata obscuriglobus TaxID=114 RepID=A0A2Z3GXK6_9BACT|nr:flagellar motor switch protein FliM [Gemmata obscuriglobus]AWM37381.1 flagellar motor switch protein FliM [Gemmata obscuriglobus]QEG29860.1 flagellar motor switch protein FliM [Gemmata obscuriglobus]VTS09177.1 Flagellar motor switch protein FliM OS=Enterococcus casseliflavus EC20 GN=ECBG_01276 PE=4 SV=2: SpoA [Gemmata obscuriglobus UQM 2246]